MKWKFRSLYRAGASIKLADVLGKCNDDITAIQARVAMGKVINLVADF